MIKQMTFGELHGAITPPKSRPSSNIKTKPRTETLPSQSIALSPSKALVRGLWTSRKTRSKTKAKPWMGKLTQKFPMPQISARSNGWVS